MSQPLLKPDDFDVTAPLHWHRHSAGLQKALDYAGNTHSLEDVRRQLFDGDTFWFAAKEYAMVAEILDYPQRRIGRIWLATGSLKAMRALTPYFTQWFENKGCTAVWIWGRPGWQRVLSNGKMKGAILALELGD